MKCTTCSAEIKENARFCASCGQMVAANSPAESSRERLPSSSRAARKAMGPVSRRVYAFSTLLLLGFFGYLFVDYLPGKANPVIERQPSVAMSTMYTGQTIEQYEAVPKVEENRISIPLSLLLEKKIVAFDYRMETTTVPLLAFINSDGRLVTAIRLCEPCNSKTFRIEGTELACGNCETHWKLSNLEGVQGSCQKYPPSPIPSVVDGKDGQVVIDKAAIRNWKIRI